MVVVLSITLVESILSDVKRREAFITESAAEVG